MHMILNRRIEDLFFFQNMIVKGCGNLPPQPGQPLCRFASISRQPQNTKLFVKFIY